MCSTCQTKSPNVNFHHYSEYADLKYTCDSWKYMYEQFFHNKGKLEIINKLCCYWNTTTTIFDPYWETSNQACSTKENTSTINQWVKLILHSTAVVWFNSLIHHHCQCCVFWNQGYINFHQSNRSLIKLLSVRKTVHAWMEGDRKSVV